MCLDDELPQPPAQAGIAQGSKGEARKPLASEEETTTTRGEERSGTSVAMEAVVDDDNLAAALKRVQQNRGSPGVDGMTTEELAPYLAAHLPRLREDLLAGRYRPAQVKRVLIPKADGGSRELGIPTVVDRLVQQALLQVLQGAFDKTFSPHSYGFRPGRSAHQALLAAQAYVQEGRDVVVDVDLEKFFDRVSHDILMGRLAKRIDDKRILKIVRRYLEAGVMAQGVVQERSEGTPQGGPLSPFLANVLLDEVDKELEKRGHAFCRYADDLNVYVRSERAGERVMALLQRLFDGLKLRINKDKSAVGSPFVRKFLGYSMTRTPEGKVKLRVHKKAREKLKAKIRQMTRRVIGRSLDSVIKELRRYLLGWKAYFGLAETPTTFSRIDGWIRRRLRALRLKQWRRGPTAYRKLRQLGATAKTAARIAAHLRSWWHNARSFAHTVMTNSYFDELGLPRLGP